MVNIASKLLSNLSLYWNKGLLNIKLAFSLLFNNSSKNLINRDWWLWRNPVFLFELLVNKDKKLLDSTFKSNTLSSFFISNSLIIFSCILLSNVLIVCHLKSFWTSEINSIVSSIVEESTISI